MLNLQKNIDNKVYATLTCDSSASLNTNKFTLSIYSVQQNAPINLLLTDSSTVTDRYNLFTVHSGSLNSLSAGYYNYSFYPSGSTVILETGKCRITEVTGSKYTYNGTDNKPRFAYHKK